MIEDRCRQAVVLHTDEGMLEHVRLGHDRTGGFAGQRDFHKDRRFILDDEDLAPFQSWASHVISRSADKRKLPEAGRTCRRFMSRAVDQSSRAQQDVMIELGSRTRGDGAGSVLRE